MKKETRPIPAHLAGSECLFRGIRFEVRSMRVPRDGGRISRHEVVLAPDAGVILPLVDDRTVILIRNERVAVGQTLWELPAGTFEPGEDPMVCAARELIEETGYRAGRLEPLMDLYPSPGICTERMHVFVARDLEHVGQDLDEDEQIAVEVVGLDRSIQMVRDHTIRDGKTIATLLYYRAFIETGR
jgi:ADP-ribose pyrophosphatase